MWQTLFVVPHEIRGVPLFGFGWALAIWAIVLLVFIAHGTLRKKWGKEQQEQLFMFAIIGAAIYFVFPNIEQRDPFEPTVEYLQSRADSLLTQIRDGDSTSVKRLIRRHSKYADETVSSIDHSSVSLADCQHVIAIEAEAISWNDLIASGRIGIPIRGYGTFMLFGIISGVALAVHRSRPLGLNSESILTLAMFMCITGILGARVFYVIQKWETDFAADTVFESLQKIFRFWEGGLVVYGSLMVAMVGMALFCRRYNVPFLRLGDAIAPSMLLGLAIGRIGCLMNGCCWGGVCDNPMAIHFPIASPPYMAQLADGSLVGLELNENDDETKIDSIKEGSLAASRSFSPGDEINDIRTIDEKQLRLVFEQPRRYGRHADLLNAVEFETRSASGAETVSFGLKELPGWTLPMYPTQIFSSVNALLLCLALLAYHPLRRWDGETFAWTLTIYPISRSLLEIIRTDEAGQFGTNLTPSQWVSVIAGILVVCLWGYLWKQGQRAAEPQPG